MHLLSELVGQAYCAWTSFTRRGEAEYGRVSFCLLGVLSSFSISLESQVWSAGLYSGMECCVSVSYTCLPMAPRLGATGGMDADRSPALPHRPVT